MKISALAIGVLAISLQVVAQSAPPAAQSVATPAEARKLADKAMSLFKEEKFAEGYELLKPYWPLPPVEIDSLANQTNTQWPIVRQRFGTSLAYEFIKERRAGASFMQYMYIQKFQRHAVRWIFVFYKPEDRWLINTVSFDDGVSQLFE